MQFRVGKCGSCGATFKVPASFGGDKAKCKSCGNGVVAIGPVQSAAPKKEEPKKKEDEELVEYKPSGKKKDGPSMLEKLRAERAASAGKAQAPKVPATRPARKGQSPGKSRSAGKAGSAGAAKNAGAAKSAGKAKGGTRARAGAGARTAGRAAAKPSRSRGAGTSRSSARRAGASRARRGEDDGEGSGAGRRGRTEKKKSPLPLIGALVLLVGLGLGAWKMMGSKDTQAAENGKGENAVAEANQAAPTENTAEEGAEAGAQEAATENADASATEESSTPDSTAAAADEGVKLANEDPASKGPTSIPVSTPDSEIDPNAIDLSSFEPLPKDPDCSDEEWAQILELTAQMADEWSPRDAARAVDKLAEIGRFAYPAMVNEMLKLDLTTPEGHRQGDFYQRAMEKLLGGLNYGWKYDFETAPNRTALFNKMIVRKFYQTGRKIAGKPNAWNNLSKNPLNSKRPDIQKPAADEGEIEIDDSVLDDLDDLDDF